jgi:hypothetical protein
VSVFNTAYFRTIAYRIAFFSIYEYYLSALYRLHGLLCHNHDVFTLVVLAESLNVAL